MKQKHEIKMLQNNFTSATAKYTVVKRKGFMVVSACLIRMTSRFIWIRSEDNKSRKKCIIYIDDGLLGPTLIGRQDNQTAQLRMIRLSTRTMVIIGSQHGTCHIDYVSAPSATLYFSTTQITFLTQSNTQQCTQNHAHRM